MHFTDLLLHQYKAVDVSESLSRWCSAALRSHGYFPRILHAAATCCSQLWHYHWYHFSRRRVSIFHVAVVNRTVRSFVTGEYLFLPFVCVFCLLAGSRSRVQGILYSVWHNYRGTEVLHARGNSQWTYGAVMPVGASPRLPLSTCLVEHSHCGC